MSRVVPAAALAAVLAAVPARPAEPQPPPAPAAPTPPAAAPPAAAPAAPQSTWPLPAGAALEVPVGSAVYRAKREPPRRADARERWFRGPGETLDASDALDEMLDELGADVARLGAARVSPILLQRVRVSGNLDPGLAGIVEARLAAALMRAADAPLLRCEECDATRAEVVDAAWVVSRGITRREQALEIARRHGARTFLSATLSAGAESVALPSAEVGGPEPYAPPNMTISAAGAASPARIAAWLALDVELVRAEDGAIVYAESYRFGGSDAVLWRGADRTQTRQERLRELEERLAARPVWSFSAHAGVASVQAKGLGTTVIAGYGAARLDERFGEDRRSRISLIAGGISHANVSAGVFQLAVAGRVSPPGIWNHVVELGLAGGGFVAGGLGNAAMATVTIDYRPAVRIGFQGAIGYVGKFRLGKRPSPYQLPTGQIVVPEDLRPTVGGLYVQTGVGMTW